VLLSADGVGTNEIMRPNGTSKTCVRRWQQRFMEEASTGPLCKTRPSRVPGHGPEVAERMVALTFGRPADRDDPLDGRSDGAGERH
jgi:hypothetical protein